MEGPESSHVLIVPNQPLAHNFPIKILYHGGMLVTDDEPILTHHYHCQSPHSTIGFTLRGENSMSFDKCKMIYIHHYRTIDHSVTALKVPVLHLFSPH